MEDLDAHDFEITETKISFTFHDSDLPHESLKPKSNLTDFILLFGGKNVLLITRLL